MRQLANVVTGYGRKQESLSREQWLMARKLLWATLAPHMKTQVSEHELMPFEWERQAIARLSLEEQAQAAKNLELQMAFWDRIDNKRNQA